MSVKVASYKKLPSTEQYACSVLTVQKWAKGLADLRIEFGKRRIFQFDSRCVHRPKIQGIIVVNAWIDSQRKPALSFYPIPNSQYPEKAQQEFQERILADLRIWIEDRLARDDAEFAGQETLLVEFKGGVFIAHSLRYL